MVPILETLNSPQWRDYELLDSGESAKLERFGKYIFIRPEHQAIWSRKLPKKDWDSAHAEFVPTAGDEIGGKWRVRRSVDVQWEMRYRSLIFQARFAQSRHLGVFPEQAAQWDWISHEIRRLPTSPKVLNLFGYTGLASLSAVQAGAHVTHVDAAKKSISWARENQALSGLEDQPIRWIVDDAMKFVLREHRRNVKYDGIIMDPPKFGRGPKGEIWTGLDMLPELLKACRNILSAKPLFIVITAYAIRASALSLYYALDEMMDGSNGKITCGELVTIDSCVHRVISSAIFARWSSLDPVN